VRLTADQAVADHETDDELPSTPQAAPAKRSIKPTTRRHAMIVDIETAPLPEDELWKIVPPFDPSTIKPFPAFDPAAVKTGNLKDAIKIAEKLAAAEAQHAVDAAAHAAKSATAESDYKAAVIDKAALDALTGRVVAVGYLYTEEGETEVFDVTLPKMTERKLIEMFWASVQSCGEATAVIGHNLHGFDLPFLIRRSFILGIPIPAGTLENGRYFASNFVDTMRVWACGVGGMNSFVKLGTLARAFGIGGKNGDGALFYRLLETDYPAAKAYLENDLILTAEVARRLHVCV
jgi:hypothetical protein